VPSKPHINVHTLFPLTHPPCLPRLHENLGGIWHAVLCLQSRTHTRAPLHSHTLLATSAEKPGRHLARSFVPSKPRTNVHTLYPLTHPPCLPRLQKNLGGIWHALLCLQSRARGPAWSLPAQRPHPHAVWHTQQGVSAWQQGVSAWRKRSNVSDFLLVDSPLNLKVLRWKKATSP